MDFFNRLWTRKNKRGKVKTVDDHDMNFQTLLKDLRKSSSESGYQRSTTASFSFTALTGRPGPESFCFNTRNKVMNHESPVAAVLDSVPLPTNSGSDLQAHSQTSDSDNRSNGAQLHEKSDTELDFWASSKLKRSCSDLSTARMQPVVHLPLSKCRSYREIQRSEEEDKNNGRLQDTMSPVSIFSADKVILKKHSSAQILPSKSKRLWWKLLLWSHRDLHKTRTGKSHPVEEAMLSSTNQLGGYSSDSPKPSNMECPWGESTGKAQWIAVPEIPSPLSRVDKWIMESCTLPQDEIVNAQEETDVVELPPPSEKGRPSPGKGSSQSHWSPSANNTEEDTSQANTFIRSLNSSSNVAHISGVGLRVIPLISIFSSLRAVNLSGNLIVNITPGSLPRGLHVLDLSKNKIHTIEGLRELTRLRVLNLSYNRISRIGQGLSSCTMIKELYLAGNKISLVEGMHRLLKLTVLDISFNKITAAKALGQLVANYNSLLALNLLGNPLQNNINHNHLRKIVSGLLPKLALLNKQPINPQKAREIREESNAKGVLGNSTWNNRQRKSSKRLLQSQGSSSVYVRRTSKSSKMKQRSKNEVHRNHSP